MLRAGGFRSFDTAGRTIRTFDVVLWLRKGFGFADARTMNARNRSLALCFGLARSIIG